MNVQHAAGQRLLRLARPYLDCSNREGLAAALQDAWSLDCLVLLLDDQDTEVALVTLVCLGLVGDESVCPAVARRLHHEDYDIVAAAEDALWSIWFRAGGTVAQSVLYKIARRIQANDTDDLIPVLTELIRARPAYAEAVHQRSQAHYLAGEYDAALRDARRTVKLNPLHFGALANQAHALAAIGRYSDALAAYRQVQTIHPQMPGVRAAVRCLRERLTRSPGGQAFFALTDDD